MAYPLANLAYSSVAKAILPSALEARMNAVPVPEKMLEELGCYVSSDSSAVVGQVVTRTVQVKCTSAATASCTPHRAGGYSGAPIESTTVTAPGSGYVRPPAALVLDPSTESLGTFLGQGGKGARLAAYLGLVGRGATGIAVGLGYSAQTIAGLVGGMPLGTNRVTQARPGFGAVDPQLFTGSTGCGTRLSDPPASGALNTLACVRSVVVKSQGIGYNPATTSLLFLGGSIAPGGRQAVAFPTFDAMGRFIKATVVDPGLGYVTTPTVALVDTSPTPGRGASGTVNMVRGHSAQLSVTIGGGGAITSVNIVDPGDGYVSMPDLVIWDPTGGGSGASYTVGPLLGTPSCFGVSRVDVLARGSGYVAPAITLIDFFSATGLNAFNLGSQNLMLNAFHNLMKTNLRNAVGTAVTETLS
jgi:hypothetical protein